MKSFPTSAAVESAAIKGLQRLLLEILRGRVARLLLVTKDRLLRFGSELLSRIEVVIPDAVPDTSREQQLTEDLVEILAVFSSELYRSPSRKNLRALTVRRGRPRRPG